MSNSNLNTSGVTTLKLLGVVFVTLKLIGIIDWSWWWVTAPFWGVIAILIGFALICFLLGAIFFVLEFVFGASTKKKKIKFLKKKGGK